MSAANATSKLQLFQIWKLKFRKDTLIHTAVVHRCKCSISKCSYHTVALRQFIFDVYTDAQPAYYAKLYIDTLPSSPAHTKRLLEAWIPLTAALLAPRAYNVCPLLMSITSKEPSPQPHRARPPATAMEYGKSVSLACDTACTGDRASKALTVPSAPAVTTKLPLADPAEMMLPTAPFPLALTCAAMSQAQTLLLGSHLQYSHTDWRLTTGQSDCIINCGHICTAAGSRTYTACSSGGTLRAASRIAQHALQMPSNGSHLKVAILSARDEAVSA